jgi:hypothetical protein
VVHCLSLKSLGYMTSNYGLNPSLHIPYKVPPLVFRQVLRDISCHHSPFGTQHD